ncbi:MAG: UxaA family hydrolase [Candidatus Hydrogenedentota bacterium]|nr:MAG: UxaA family hydrolase [Candidatus Hydrogenedentota bacterium]
MKNNALKINENDNVAIASEPIRKGDPVIVSGERLLDAAEDVEAGHKVALAPIETGENVFRYGEPIVEATCPIGRGEWVHVHNTRPIPGDLKE